MTTGAKWFYGICCGLLGLFSGCILSVAGAEWEENRWREATGFAGNVKEFHKVCAVTCTVVTTTEPEAACETDTEP